MTLRSKLLKTIVNSLFVLCVVCVVCCLDFFFAQREHTILPGLLFKTNMQRFETC